MDHGDSFVRPLRQEDVPEVVTVHLAAFPGFFLSFLGPTFLRHLYRGIVQDSTGVSFVSVRDGVIQGFVAGTIEPSGFYRRLLGRRWWGFGLACVLPALRNPRIIPRLLRAFTKAKESAVRERSSLLMSLAVVPGGQSAGTGTALVAAFTDEARRRGSARILLTTDAIGNNSVNRFYLRRGFTLARTFSSPENRLMNEYHLEL